MICDKCGSLIPGEPYVISEDMDKHWHSTCYRQMEYGSFDL